MGRRAGYDDVNDADRLSLDPVMRREVGGRALDTKATSASLAGRFTTEVRTTSDKNILFKLFYKQLFSHADIIS